MAHVFLWLIIIIPWISLFLMDKSSLKRFMPVGMLGAILVSIIFDVGSTFNLWTILDGIFPWEHYSSYPLNYGAFFVGTLWVFYFTYDKSFWTYILTNAIVDGLYAFGILNLFIYWQIIRLDLINKFGVGFIMFLLAFILYAYQRWQDSIFEKTTVRKNN